MAIIDYLGNELSIAYDIDGNSLKIAMDVLGNIVWSLNEEPGGEPGGGTGGEPVFVPYTFVAISDVHYGANCPNENERFTSWCVYTASHMPDMILATGDLTNATNYRTSSGANHPGTALKAAGIPYTYGVDGNRVYWAWGNHENNSTDTLDTLCAAFDATMGAGASQTNWFDFQGDRFIMMHFRNMNSKRAQFTIEDLETLQTALSTAGDKRVFLIQHCPDYRDKKNRSMCGDYGKLDTGHWGYNAPDIEWGGSAMDTRDVFQSILDAHVLAHPGKLIWLHGHTHKPVAYRRDGYNSENWDDTYFKGNGWTVHIPSLGRPQTESGHVTTYGEWAVFTVKRDAVSVSYRHVEGNTVTDDMVQVMDGYGFDIPCAGIGMPAEDGGTWVVRLVGVELYVDEAPTACVRMDGNDIILEDAG